MTKDDFLKKIELLDKKQGNYKETTNVMAERQERLQQETQQFIDVFEHLINKGYKVYVQELLCGNGLKSKPRRWSHLWLPEINTTIRFTPRPSCEIHEIKAKFMLARYIKSHRPYCYTFVIQPDSTLDYVDEKIEYCKEFYNKDLRKGIVNDIVVPQKKKRARIKTTSIYEKVETQNKNITI